MWIAKDGNIKLYLAWVWLPWFCAYLWAFDDRMTLFIVPVIVAQISYWFFAGFVLRFLYLYV